MCTFRTPSHWGVVYRAPLRGLKGFNKEKIDLIEETIADAFDIRFVFNKWTLGNKFCTDALGFTETQLDDANFSMLNELGFTEEIFNSPKEEYTKKLLISDS